MFSPLLNVSIVSATDLSSDMGIVCGSARTSQVDLGEWFYPDGRRVPAFGVGEPLYVLFRISSVELFAQQFDSSQKGIYHCRIPDEDGVMQSLYVGIYTDQGDGQLRSSFVAGNLQTT
jgi:hypothetical protein